MFVLFCDGPFWLAFNQNTTQAMNLPKTQRVSIFPFGTYIIYKDRSLAKRYGSVWCYWEQFEKHIGT
jgi:hypothetical protein